ncbi:MAG: DUF2802 domain-containing protein [Gammaproteobacteria bacterium]|uniref:ATPase involved in DNA repair n=1 Tax=Marinobacter nitratireducens TaxID=1137280 RepID=A0A072NFR7_9GAMM|nr:DUF2802 domain-containing protein [Marinobacter nitratireducens]KEF31955.1 ATPase involved in DNA repair [Marinobacter nitratireducens]TNE73570.1 MAG: DUF2802 domain-containing protein [Gammaproteobacteria bacterium]TNE95523.1 MAG: DUF2802 domain-containing protein [Gammaproteobacteria bacterium]
MFAEIPTYVPWGLTAMALCLVLIQGVRQSRQIRQLRGSLKERCDTLGRELHATTSGSMGVGQRLVACERQLHELRTMLDEMRQNDPLRISYDEASRLVDLGAEIDDLMNTCGISRPEAELVSALRKRQAA